MREIHCDSKRSNIVCVQDKLKDLDGRRFFGGCSLRPLMPLSAFTGAVLDDFLDSFGSVSGMCRKTKQMLDMDEP